ncbi:MAG: hypothetical protein DRN04_12050 [Thermoprotei archaeon]|nr:MAG: hypothetical protein DRN04_12050 [Thermoprotei archaeon]
MQENFQTHEKRSVSFINKLIEWKLILSRYKVLEKNKIAYVPCRESSEWSFDYGLLEPLYRNVRRVTNPNQIIPKKNYYITPLILPHLKEEFSKCCRVS